MARCLPANNVSEAWVQAMEFLLAEGGTASNLISAIAPTGSGKEVPEVRQIMDSFLSRWQTSRIRRIRKVADTIFPVDFYKGEPGQAAREHLYRMQRQASRIERRHISRGTYFDRLIDWPGSSDSEDELGRNQLERRVRLMKSYWDRGTRNHNAYELALSDGTIEDECLPGNELRLQHPLHDNSIMGFPCLSHISLTLFRGRLDLTAVYRNQHFITKAYGNLIGLSDLQRFIATEVGCEIGELVCVATHADAEASIVRKACIRQLVHDCRSALDSTV